MRNGNRITVPQVAIAFCVNKGIVPVCGGRKPKQVKELAEATNVVLTKKEIKILELSADKANARIMGPDLFRPFVKKEKRNLSF